MNYNNYRISINISIFVSLSTLKNDKNKNYTNPWGDANSRLALIGYAAEGVVILISFGVSCVNPEVAKNLYKVLNLYDLRQFGFLY